MKKLLFISLLFSSVILSAQEFDKQKLDTYINSLQANHKASLAVAISKSNKPVYENYAGFLSDKNERKIDSNTKFRIGSITKTFTAVIIFQLIEEGKITLDTKVNQFFPEMKNADKITIAHLLSHQSGIYNFTDAPSFMSIMTQEKSKEELLEIIKSQASDFEPGTQTSYSNSGYVLLGLIIEKLTGESYISHLNTRIIKKLNLKHTAYGNKIELEKNEANSMNFQNGKWTNFPLESNMSVPFSAGAIVSTPNDLNEFTYALFHNKLVSAKSLVKMKEIKNGLGHGLFSVPFYDKKAFGHNGKIDNFEASAYHFEVDDLSISVLTNGLTISFNDILVGVLSIYYNKEFTLPNFDQKPIELNAESLEKYSGLFSSEALPIQIVINAEGGKITAQATGQAAFPLTPFSNREFRFDQAAIVILFGGTENEVDYSTFTLKQGGQQFVFKKQ
ncbi:serine hydrolase domain-containing protein [Roseivirga seohaensis]|uniref:serine hydrolase domain-containing protein n=1 Tax=Roseivirga seohaensis TaxID=1914963 RepID=UPI003BAD7E28